MDQYINDYHFTVPHLYSNITHTDLYMTYYMAVVIPTIYKDELLVDGVPAQYMGNSRSKSQFPVPSPYSNYTVLSFEIPEGYHRIRHRLEHVNFGLLVYGLGRNSSYNPFSTNNNYTSSYGFFAGFNLQGSQCESNNAGPTTTQTVPNFYTSLTTTNVPPENNATMCYSCEGLEKLSLCDTVKVCHGKQVCFLERQNNSGRVVYRSGCLDSDVCSRDRYESMSHSNFCVECCSGNFCNNKGCGDSGLPTRDQRGPVCYDCQHVSSPELCSSVALCSHHQVCRIEKLAWGEDYHYKMGCANTLCDPLTRAFHLVSKRATPVCHTCCTDDFCNSNCTRTSGGPVIVG